MRIDWWVLGACLLTLETLFCTSFSGEAAPCWRPNNRPEGRLSQWELEERAPRWPEALLKGEEITVDAGCGADHPAFNLTVAEHQGHHYLCLKRGAC